MARIKYGGIITDISGSVGGSTFQKSLFGNTLRNKPNPHKSATQSQLIIRSYMFTIHAAWRALSDAQRIQWNRYINFSGQTIKRDSGITMTGHDLFIKYNMFRLNSGLSLLMSPSYSSLPSPPSFVSFIYLYDALRIVFASSVNPATLWFLLRISSPRIPSLAFSSQGLRFVRSYLAASDSPSINTSYLSVFGLLPQLNQSLHYSYQFFSTLSPVYSSVVSGISKVS